MEGSFTIEARVELGKEDVVCSNLGAEWGTCWKKLTGEEANPVFRSAATCYAKQLCNDQQRKSSGKAKKTRIATNFKKTTTPSSTQ